MDTGVFATSFFRFGIEKISWYGTSCILSFGIPVDGFVKQISYCHLVNLSIGVECLRDLQKRLQSGSKHYHLAS